MSEVQTDVGSTDSLCVRLSAYIGRQTDNGTTNPTCICDPVCIRIIDRHRAVSVGSTNTYRYFRPSGRARPTSLSMDASNNPLVYGYVSANLTSSNAYEEDKD